MPGTPGTKYYLKTRSNGQEGRIYLISEGGSASIRRFVLPGTTLNEKVEIIAEIPTALGNTLVKHEDYHLLVSNPYYRKKYSEVALACHFKQIKK